MTDGQRRGEEPESYDWLYGTSSKGVGSGDPTELLPGAPEPEATQVIKRPEGGTPPASARGLPKSEEPAWIAPHPGAKPPAGPPGGPTKPPKPPKTKKKRRWRIRPFRIIFLVLVLWIAYLVAVPFFAWKDISQVDASPDVARLGDQPGNTYLLVGSDSREGLTAKQRERLHTGGDVGQRTDTIMLLHTGDGPNLLMSIPRDSIVNVPGHGETKINAAYAYGGPQLLVQTIEEATGIRIDHYVEIGFGGFVNMVNAVGGITICPKTDMVDEDANLNVKAGCQPANGKKALAYARSRHAQELGDIDRAKNQREVVSQVGSKAFSPWTFLNPVRYYKLAFAGAESVKVGDDVGPVAFANFANAMRSVDGKSGLTCGVPIADFAVHWDRERADRMFRLIREDRTSEIGKSLCQPSGLAR
ncbi:MAG TPA: LCP family protein [Nocardioidaceae bacterium]|nr:LCP family protein [Nocardioidaceae bacterium]